MIRGLILDLTQQTAMTVTQDYIYNTHDTQCWQQCKHNTGLTQLTQTCTTPCANSTQHSIIHQLKKYDTCIRTIHTI